MPEGPVRDALRAVELGSASDPKATDWPRLKSELEDLLKKEDEQQQQQQQKQDNPQNQDKQQNQDQKQDQQQGQSKDQKENPQQSGKQDPSRSSSSQQQQQKPEERKGEEQPSAFGDMAGPTPTPTPPGAREPQQAMQKVGGVRKDQPHDPATDNPELAVPLEKLEQVKNQDSPAELFDLLRKGEPMPTPTNNGKNW